MKKTKMLKKNYEFKYVLSKGNYSCGENIEAFIKKGKREEVNFLGIAISRKICKAVKRNHIKRLIKENYYLQENKIKSGYNIIFLWKKKVDIKNATFDNIKKDMDEIFKKSQIIEEDT